METITVTYYGPRDPQGDPAEEQAQGRRFEVRWNGADSELPQELYDQLYQELLKWDGSEYTERVYKGVRYLIWYRSEGISFRPQNWGITDDHSRHCPRVYQPLVQVSAFERQCGALVRQLREGEITTNCFLACVQELKVP